MPEQESAMPVSPLNVTPENRPEIPILVRDEAPSVMIATPRQPIPEMPVNIESPVSTLSTLPEVQIPDEPLMPPVSIIPPVATVPPSRTAPSSRMTPPRTGPSAGIAPPVDMSGDRECGYCITPAMSYTPLQKWGNIYEPEAGFSRGTIFAQLDLPFIGGKAGMNNE